MFKIAKKIFSLYVCALLLIMPVFAQETIDLEAAALDCDIALLKKGIMSTDDIDVLWIDNNTALHRAAQNGCHEGVRLLLGAGASINIQNDDGETPLMKAAISSAGAINDFLSAKLLIDAGADVNIPNRFGYSPLTAVSAYGTSFTLFVDPEALKLDPETGLTQYISDEMIISKMLLEAGATIDNSLPHDKHPLYFAVLARHPNLIDILVQHGADIHLKLPRYNRNLLHVAALQGRAINIPYLIKQGIDINSLDISHATALMLATAHNRTKAMKMLIEHGADLEMKDIEEYGGRTALMLSIIVQKEDALKVLIEAGADINALTIKSKNTPLHLAAHKKWKRGVELLLQAGADPKIEDIYGQNAFTHAKNGGDEEIIAILNKE